MASKQQNLDFVLEQLNLDDVTSRKMFGEYAIYCRGRTVALFCDDQLFIKPTNAGRAFIGTVTEGAPYPGAKPWFFVSGDRCEDGEWLSELVRLTASELPPPKPKPLKLTPAARSVKSAKSAKSAKLPKKPSMGARTSAGIAVPGERANVRSKSKRVGKSSGRVGKSTKSSGRVGKSTKSSERVGKSTKSSERVGKSTKSSERVSRPRRPLDAARSSKNLRGGI